MKTHPLLLRIQLAAVFTMTALLCQAAPRDDNSGKDLHNSNFTNENFNDAKFDGANLESANFTNATLKNASFRGARLQHAVFSKAVLDGADFTGAETKGARFTDAKVWNAKLSGMEIDLAGAAFFDIRKLHLPYLAEQTLLANQELRSGSLSFHNSDLHNCRILGNAEGVDFRGADLRSADLSEARNLDSARFGGAKYDDQTRWTIDPVKMGAELAAGGASAIPDANNGAIPKRSIHPLVGKWLIMKGEKGATEGGSLRINSDGSYEWDYSAKAPVIKGKWDEAGAQLLLRLGERGQNWTAKQSAKDEISLKSEAGDERAAISDK